MCALCTVIFHIHSLCSFWWQNLKLNEITLWMVWTTLFLSRWNNILNGFLEFKLRAFFLKPYNADDITPNICGSSSQCPLITGITVPKRMACGQNYTDSMMTSSNGNIFRVTGPLCGKFTGPGEFPAQRPVTRSFGVFFDLRPNKRLSKQP